MRNRLTLLGLPLWAGASLLLTACGGSGDGDATANADTGLTADKIAANDVTAIDAVTGEAANMAADVDYSNFITNDSGAGNNASGNTANGTVKPAAAAPRTTATTPPVAKPPLTPSSDPVQAANNTN